MLVIGDPEFEVRLLNVLMNEKVEYLARHLARDAGQIRSPMDEKAFLNLPTEVQYACRKMAVEYAEILNINWNGEDDGTDEPGAERSEAGQDGLDQEPGE